MSTNSFKSNFTVGGSPFDKTMAARRRPTPDSEALASSDDDHEHTTATTRPVGHPLGVTRRPSSSWQSDVPFRKNSLPPVSFGLQPTTPSADSSNQSKPTTLWNTSSFTAAPSPSRVKEVLPSPTSAHGPTDTPFGPAHSESEDTVGFLLNQHSTRKSVRSQSYSVGQGEVDNQASRLRSALRHRPSKPSLLGETAAIGLGQVREDEIDEIDSSTGSQHGVPLPPGYWERDRDARTQNKSMVTKQVTIDARPYSSNIGGEPAPPGPRRLSHSMRSLTQNDVDDAGETYNTALQLTRRFSEHVGTNTVAGGDHTSGNETYGWANTTPRLSADALARRHSIAHYGSNLSSGNLSFAQPTLGNTQEEDEETSPLDTAAPAPAPAAEFWSTDAYFSGFGPAARTLNASAISAAHPAPTVSHPQPTPGNAYANPTGYGRPGRRIYVVQFKCSRSDIYFLYENTGLEVRVGDLVIVEGDRGHDLGQVTHADISMEDAKRFKNAANEDHFRWLVMFSQYSVAGASNKNRMLGSLNRAIENPPSDNPPQLSGMGVQQDPDSKPRMIRRLAQHHEILQLRDKEGEEARAKRMATDRALDHNLPMEILDAEFQWDHHKISFFYYAEAYVDFKVLVTDLFKHYKIRIWMSAVNPASVVNPAGMQMKPPSAIGPGAIVPTNAPNASLSVGPLFGNNTYRSTEQQYGNRDRGAATHGTYDNTYHPFSNQIPTFPAQNAFQMHQWGTQHLGAGMYGQYANRSPMNVGAWYPPATYSASPAFNQASNAASYRGGVSSSSSFTPYSASGAAGAGAGSSSGFDPAQAMAYLNLGSKK